MKFVPIGESVYRYVCVSVDNRSVDTCDLIIVDASTVT